MERTVSEILLEKREQHCLVVLRRHGVTDTMPFTWINLKNNAQESTIPLKLDNGKAGQGRAGHGRAGQGRAGQRRAGQGRAGQGNATQCKARQGNATRRKEGARLSATFSKSFP